MKVWLYYLEDELYAFTTNKTFKEEFECQRNMECFEKRVEELDLPFFQAFQYKNRNKMMMEIPLSDTMDTYFLAIGTNEEEIELENRMTDTIRGLEEIKEYLNDIPFKKKYQKAIEEISETSILTENGDGTKDAISTVSGLSLFYHLFKNTFEVQNTEYLGG